MNKVDNIKSSENKCKNQRCITQTEKYVPQSFKLLDEKNKLYICEYCDGENTFEKF
ncbi:aspartate carbamoyltransferase [Clostridium tarantellae]|uniref:Aspartate carbamoyltransferase n=1 Tax=Clostridium tarantellae TaxID=39493 RepID=A0A6I1MLQ9_9CLOT|nr:aspartate carbamoyltransferase [Clostridium tarantellae]